MVGDKMDGTGMMLILIDTKVGRCPLDLMMCNISIYLSVLYILHAHLHAVRDVFENN